MPRKSSKDDAPVYNFNVVVFYEDAAGDLQTKAFMLANSQGYDTAARFIAEQVMPDYKKLGIPVAAVSMVMLGQKHSEAALRYVAPVICKHRPFTSANGVRWCLDCKKDLPL